MKRIIPNNAARPGLLLLVVVRVAITVSAAVTPFGSGNPAFAQESDAIVQEISTKVFIERVVASHPGAIIAEADVDAAEAQMRAAGLLQNPVVAYDREEVFEDGRGVPENFIRIQLPIDVSGRRSRLVDSARKGVNASQADARMKRVALVTDAVRVYLQAAALREQATILKESRGALDKLFESVRSRTSAGDASGYDLIRIEIEISSLNDLILEAERELTTHQFILGMLAGNPGNRIDAADDLSVRDMVFDIADKKTVDVSSVTEAARARVFQQSFARDAARRNWIPSMILTGGMKTATNSGDTVLGYIAGISLTIPVFDFGQADKQVSQAELRRAKANLLLAEHQALTRIAIARENFNQALRQTTAYERDHLSRLELLLRRSEVLYKEGERSVFELLDGHRTYREVHLRHVQLKLQTLLGHVELLEALGREPGGTL